ncbi:hypothetical protein B0A63_03855 [Flavobacterium johnsoniae UW101]|nr:hypothetical protein B0A63_03855 [Flavobacterium johnsoniae UW101]
MSVFCYFYKNNQNQSLADFFATDYTDLKDFKNTTVNYRDFREFYFNIICRVRGEKNHFNPINL